MSAERRKAMRRESDRDMIRQIQETRRKTEDTSQEVRHLRRRAVRHNCKVNIGLKAVYASGTGDTWNAEEFPLSGRVLDLSPEGCSIFSRDQMDIGQKPSLVIEMRKGGTIRAEGVIRWSKHVREHSGFASGVQFSNITSRDQQRITAFLQELDENIGL